MEGQCFRCGGSKAVRLFTGKYYRHEHMQGLKTFLCDFCTKKVQKLQRQGKSSPRPVPTWMQRVDE